METVVAMLVLTVVALCAIAVAESRAIEAVRRRQDLHDHDVLTLRRELARLRHGADELER